MIALFLITVLFGLINGCTDEWIEIVTEDQGFSDFNSTKGYQLKWLDFEQEVYEIYNVSTIISYKFEWNYNSTTDSYDDYIIFELNDENSEFEFLKDGSDSIDQYLEINILNSTVSAMPPEDGAYFCKACSSTGATKWGDTCWAITSSSELDRECGCNSHTWNGNGVYYGGYPSGTCDACGCQGGAMAGYKTDHQAKPGSSSTSVGLRISIKACDNHKNNPFASLATTQETDYETTYNLFTTIGITNPEYTKSGKIVSTSTMAPSFTEIAIKRTEISFEFYVIILLAILVILLVVLIIFIVCKYKRSQHPVSNLTNYVKSGSQLADNHIEGVGVRNTTTIGEGGDDV